MNTQNQEGQNIANYSSSERKLKRITHELPFNTNSTQLIEDKINKMKMKIAMKNETEKKQIIDNEDNGSELPKPQKRIYTENIPQYNQITSLLTDRLSKGSILNRTNQTKDHIRYANLHRPNIETYKEQCINRDKHKHPLKYKIIREEIGIQNDKKVYNLKSDQIDRIQEQFIRRKGLQYLRQGINAANLQSKKFYSNADKKGRATSLKFANANSTSKIHQIFNNPISQSKKNKSQKSLKSKVKNKIHLDQLKQHQQMLGKLVFQKVKKHLKQQKTDPNYFRRVYTEQTIDDALVDFLRVKIQRAEASLGK